MNKLTLRKLTNISELASPDVPQNVTLDSPALSIFTDFNKVEPLAIDTSVPAQEVLDLMKSAHVRFKFVVDKSNALKGVISSEELSEEAIVKKLPDGFKRREITVADIMTPKDFLSALDFYEIQKASIGDVIEALKESGQQHCLVVDYSINRVRGIFSASDVSRKLRVPINIQDKPSFYKVFSAIH